MKNPSGGEELSAERLRRRLEEVLRASSVPGERPARSGGPGPAPDVVPADPLADAEITPKDTSNPAGLGTATRAFLGRHLVVVAVIVLGGCVWAGVSLFSARTIAVPTAVTALSNAPSTSAAPRSASGAGESATTRPSVAATPDVEIVVHVLGRVRKPGLVRLSKGARVADAIAAAGGLRADARPGELNLAAFVADGAQIVIGTAASPGGEVRGQQAAGESGGGVVGVGALVDLNTATVEQLDALPGVGPVTAQAIIDWREQRRFARVEQLQEVDGIGPKTYARLAPLVTV